MLRPMIRPARLSLLLAAVALPTTAAAHDEQFMTLERADHHSKIGLQAGLHLYPDTVPDDVFGFRGELYGQAVGRLRGGGALGGYGHLALGLVFGDIDTEAVVHGLELGGFYLATLGRGTDLVLHAGVALPTASDGTPESTALLLTSVERGYDLVNARSDTTALKLGVTLHVPLGRSAFLQADGAIDLEIDAPGDNDAIFHANLGLGAYAGPVVVLGELSTAFVNDAMLGDFGVSLRFPSRAHPYVGYILAFGDDFAGDGVIAHIISFGFHATFD
jgi:hypothetical protein